jgi:acetoacetyl-CoA synthetase
VLVFVEVSLTKESGMVSTPSWQPRPEVAARSQIVAFARWLHDRGVADLSDPFDYASLQTWSTDQLETFWGSLAEFFGVKFSTPATDVLVERTMPDAQWFPNATLNFADHVGLGRDLACPVEATAIAIVMEREDGFEQRVSFSELDTLVGRFASQLREWGVGRGGCVGGYLPNCVEGVVAFLAAARIGAIWTQVGMDYAAEAAADRLAQVEPVVLVHGTGYQFRGRTHDRQAEAVRLLELLPSVKFVVSVATGGLEAAVSPLSAPWSSVVADTGRPLSAPAPVPFDHPLWVLFTSGTTGRPKGIVHSHGGVLLDQLKSVGLHLDLGPGDTYFWYTTPNWMVWNAQVCGLLRGSTIVLYDGDPAYPSPSRLWEVAARHQVSVLGTSPGYLLACERAGVAPGKDLDLSSLRTLGVTGAVLPAGAYRWVRSAVGPRIQVASSSGGTDIVGAFVTSAPTTPVYDGEISGPALGVAVAAWDANGETLIDQVGEMVVTEPMPSMPVRLWHDEDGSRYRDAYFSVYPGVWRHGDWITITQRGTVVIHGRSDSTLNRNGVRLGSADIYAVVEGMPDVAEALVVGVERPDGGYWMPMFVVSGPGWDGDSPQRLSDAISSSTSKRHVPDEIIVVDRLPHTRTGKKLEVPVKRILQGGDPAVVASLAAVDDTESLLWFADLARQRRRGSGGG